jgi:hypothetical protein
MRVGTRVAPSKQFTLVIVDVHVVQAEVIVSRMPGNDEIFLVNCQRILKLISLLTIEVKLSYKFAKSFGVSMYLEVRLTDWGNQLHSLVFLRSLGSVY